MTSTTIEIWEKSEMQNIQQIVSDRQSIPNASIFLFQKQITT